MVRKDKQQMKWKQKSKNIQKQTNTSKMSNKNHKILQDLIQIVDENSQFCILNHGNSENLQKDDKKQFIIQNTHSIKQQQNHQQIFKQTKQQFKPVQIIQDTKFCQKQLITKFLNTLNNSKQRPILRDTQIKHIKQFLIPSSSSQILYICGVTGTGKTSVVNFLLNDLNLNYQIINCLNVMQNEQSFIKSTTKIIKQSSFLVQVLVLDECDGLSILPRTISALKDSVQLLAGKTNPNSQYSIKIILISNRNQTMSFSNLSNIQQIFFMPYQAQQIRQIIRIKLQKCMGISSTQIYDKVIPRQVIEQGIKKVAKASGDFREIQKHLNNWISKHLSHKQMNKSMNNSNLIRDINTYDPFLQLLHTFFKNSSVRKNNLLLKIIQVSQRLIKDRNDKNRKFTCRCRQNVLNCIIYEMKISQLEVLTHLKEMQDLGLVKLVKFRCSYHQKVNQVGQIRLKYGLDAKIIKQILTQCSNRY